MEFFRWIFTFAHHTSRSFLDSSLPRIRMGVIVNWLLVKLIVVDWVLGLSFWGNLARLDCGSCGWAWRCFCGFIIFFFFSLAYNQGIFLIVRNFYSQSGCMAIWWFYSWLYRMAFCPSIFKLSFWFSFFPFCGCLRWWGRFRWPWGKFNFCSALLMEVDFDDLEANSFFAVLFL